jgi:hypothetical protein
MPTTDNTNRENQVTTIASLDGDNDDNFTMVSYKKRGTTPRATPTRAVSTRAHTAASQLNNASTLSMATFSRFHEQVYRLIMDLAQRNTRSDAPFYQKWKAITTLDSNKVTATSSFRVVAKALQISHTNLGAYVTFLKSCPTISKYMEIIPSPSGSTTFLYRFLDVTPTNNTSNELSVATPVRDPTDKMDILDTDTITTVRSHEVVQPSQKRSDEFMTCYSNDSDFTAMLGVFWPCIQAFLTENPEHEHAKQWQAWIDQGLNQFSQLTFIKTLLGTETLDQLFLFFRDSPALKDEFDLVWDHKINYRHKNKAAPITPPIQHLTSTTVGTIHENPYGHEETIRNTVTAAIHPINFSIFHKKVLKCINWHFQQMSDKSGSNHCQWQTWILRGLGEANTFADVCHIMKIATLSEYVDMLSHIPLFRELVSIKWHTDGQKLYYDIKEPIPMPDIAHDAISHLKKEFAEFSELLDAKLISMKRSVYDLEAKVLSCEHSVRSHFQSYKEKLTEIMDTSLSQATSMLQEKIQQVTENALQQTIGNLNTSMADKTQHFERTLNSTVDDILQDVYTSADEAHHTMEKYKHDVLVEMENGKSKIEELIQELQRSREPSGPPHTKITTNETGPNVTSHPRWPHVRLDPSYKRSHNPFEAPTSRPHTKTGTPNNQSDNSSPYTHHLQPCTSSNLHAPIRATTNPMPTDDTVPYPNAALGDTHTQTYTIPNTVHMPTGHQHRHSMSPRPHMTQTTFDQHTALPVLNQDAAIKRAKIQYTGLGDMFVFYTQMLNALEQFGIFLVPLNQVKHNTSLCPLYHNNIAITEQRYQSMSKTLYQKLQNPDVIPMEHTSIRNIINRFAECNDGYQVLYAMLELVHPALHEDAVLLPPKSADCDEDIHLYAQKFDSWLRYENYANRLYSPREQVNSFIRELSPVFAPAISRIRRLLDTWQPYDNNTPNALCLKQLPNTIERYMAEESSTPYIRRLRPQRQRLTDKSTHPNKDSNDKTQEKERQTRQIVDIFCPFCGAHGHAGPQCDFMAKFLKAHDSLKLVDTKKKEKLQETYRNEQQKRRSRHIKKKMGTIRQILTDGGTYQDVESLLDSIPELIQQVDDSSSSEASSSSASSDASKE